MFRLFPYITLCGNLFTTCSHVYSAACAVQWLTHVTCQSWVWTWVKGFPCFIEVHSLGFEPHQRLPLLYWGTQSWVWTSSKAPLVILRYTVLGLNLIKGFPCFIETHTIYFLNILGGSGTDLSVYYFTIIFLLKWIEDHIEDWLKCQISPLVKYCLSKLHMCCCRQVWYLESVCQRVILSLYWTRLLFFFFSHQS